MFRLHVQEVEKNRLFRTLVNGKAYRSLPVHVSPLDESDAQQTCVHNRISPRVAVPPFCLWGEDTATSKLQWSEIKEGSKENFGEAKFAFLIGHRLH